MARAWRQCRTHNLLLTGACSLRGRYYNDILLLCCSNSLCNTHAFAE